MTLPQFQLTIPAPAGAPFAGLDVQHSDKEILSVHYLSQLEGATSPQNEFSAKIADDFRVYFENPESGFARIEKLTPCYSMLEAHMQGCKLSPNDCWKALEKMRKAIPFGKVCTYSKIGSKVDWDKQAVVEAYHAPDVNNPFAKAIGDVCSVNPFAVVVPCFRIINADHTLGGFMGNPHVDRETGIKIKGWLLEHEGRRVAKPITKKSKVS